MDRYMICRQFGADVRLTAPAKGMPGMKAYVEELLGPFLPVFFCDFQEENAEIAPFFVHLTEK